MVSVYHDKPAATAKRLLSEIAPHAVEKPFARLMARAKRRK